MQRIIFIVLYVAPLGLVAFLTDRCLRRWKRTASRAGELRKFWLIPFTLFTLLPLAGALLPEMPVRYACQAVGNVWLGFVLYFGGLLAVLMGVAAVVRVLRKARPGRSVPGAILCLSLCGALALFGYGLVHAQQTRVVSYALDVEKPADGDEAEMTLVLIGDLHLGVNSRFSTTERMVELINAQQPDVVVVAGDIFTSCYGGLAHPERYAEALRGIRAKYGVYAVYGNHDVEEALLGGFPVEPISKAFRTDEMAKFCESSGFTMLLDEMVVLPNGVQLAGRVDGQKAGDGTKNRMSAAELLSGADPAAPILVLQHEPTEFKALKEAGADAALCGHTHAGQVFPGNLIVPFFNENAWGHKVVHGLDTFVTAGVGYYGPLMRVGTDSEVTVIHVGFQ